jgi:Zn-dependent peptidase ImmA (M78 family)/transcriptional regulator with XRE-family HTH domain
MAGVDEMMLDRIRQAMHSAGWNQHDLGERIGLDDTKMSKAMTGKRRFSSLEVALIAQACKQSVDWLLNGTPQRMWRVAARSSLDQNTSDRVGEQAISHYAERWDALHKLQLTPAVPSLPDRSPSKRWVTQANELAEWATQMLAATMGRDLHSLVSVVEERLGINVAIAGLPVGLDGLSYQDGDFRMIVLARTDVYARQRYTLGHEIGHVLWGDANECVLAENISRKAPQDESHQEERANAFAAAFLMPRPEIETVMGERSPDAAFADLVWHFQVSPEPMAWRLKNTGHIDKDEAERLATRSVRSIAMSLGKTADHVQLADRSRNERKPWRLVSAHMDAYDRGLMTLRPIADLLGQTLEEAEAFFGNPDDAITIAPRSIHD